MKMKNISETESNRRFECRHPLSTMPSGFWRLGTAWLCELVRSDIVVRIRRLRISMKAGKKNKAVWLSRSRSSSTDAKNAANANKITKIPTQEKSQQS